MSIDTDVIPTLDQFFTWANLKSQLFALPLSSNAAMLLGQNPKLRVLGTRQEVENDQAILPTNYYYFQLTRDKYQESDSVTHANKGFDSLRLCLTHPTFNLLL